MGIEKFKRAGISLNHCHWAVVPEIPYVQDVLYALRLSTEQKNYDFCLRNHATYVVNVALVIAACGDEVLCMERYDEMEARKIIARTILDLCRPEDRCLFNSAVIEAMETAVGEPVTAKTMDRAALYATCDCPKCRKLVRGE